MCPYSYKQACRRVVAAQIDPWKKILKSCRQSASTHSVSTVPLQMESLRSECQDTCFSAHLHEPKGAQRNNDRQGNPNNSWGQMEPLSWLLPRWFQGSPRSLPWSDTHQPEPTRNTPSIAFQSEEVGVGLLWEEHFRIIQDLLWGEGPKVGEISMAWQIEKKGGKSSRLCKQVARQCTCSQLLQSVLFKLYFCFIGGGTCYSVCVCVYKGLSTGNLSRTQGPMGLGCQYLERLECVPTMGLCVSACNS